MRLAYGLAAAVAVTAFATTAEAACPDWRAAPSFGQITLNAGFLPDPYRRRVTAGGGNNLAACSNWNGWIAVRPDFDLRYSAGGYKLTIAIESSVDTILLINAPDGQWYYNDDSANYGLGASYTFNNPQSGLYDIWIGTYNRASGIPANLIITEQ
ncbi:MAG: hypothetical protein IT535_04565 [Bauldia sp.]|nr:hypothetical protein [Bauldia sp.]